MRVPIAASEFFWHSAKAIGKLSVPWPTPGSQHQYQHQYQHYYHSHYKPSTTPGINTSRTPAHSSADTNFSKTTQWKISRTGNLNDGTNNISKTSKWNKVSCIGFIYPYNWYQLYLFITYCCQWVVGQLYYLCQYNLY